MTRPVLGAGGRCSVASASTLLCRSAGRSIQANSPVVSRVVPATLRSRPRCLMCASLCMWVVIAGLDLQELLDAQGLQLHNTAEVHLRRSCVRLRVRWRRRCAPCRGRGALVCAWCRKRRRTLKRWGRRWGSRVGKLTNLATSCFCLSSSSQMNRFVTRSRGEYCRPGWRGLCWEQEGGAPVQARCYEGLRGPRV